jgi:diguanylate cyclase (GGDEF)-like protein
VNPPFLGISAIPGSIALLLLAVFTFLYHRTRNPYFRAWQFAWAAYALSRTALVVYFSGYPAPGIELASNVGFVIMAIFVFRSTRIIYRDYRWHSTDTAFLLIGTVWSGYDVLARISPERWGTFRVGNWTIEAPPVEVAAAPLLLLAGIRFWKHARERDSLGFRVLALALWFWCPLLVAAGFHSFFQHIGVWGHVLGPIPQMMLGMAMIMVLYENMAFEERSRSRHLVFLNNVATTAISTSDAAKMLAEISSEIRRNFSFDHIGIGIIDYARNTIEIRADAGVAGGLSGRELPIEHGMIGRAARSAQIMVEQGTGERTGALLPNARSVLCAPILHGETMLGVLNVESSTPNAFGEQETLILRTLADLLAAALHNAYVFQGMQQQAITDSLTGTKTRRYFLESLQSEWRRASRSGRPFSVVMVDLDKFKDVNDSMGHIEGDLVVGRVGRVLEEHCRHSNVVARYGGDEFVILMPETTLEQSMVLSDRLRSSLQGDVLLKGRNLTGSFGVATYPLHGDTPEAILQQADRALYHAKRRGGNCVETVAMAESTAV